MKAVHSIQGICKKYLNQCGIEQNNRCLDALVLKLEIQYLKLVVH
jgi:hypothetical protein